MPFGGFHLRYGTPLPGWAAAGLLLRSCGRPMGRFMEHVELAMWL